MISLEDCIALCGLDDEEVQAIGEHEHLPQIEAAAVASELMHEAGGPARIRGMLVDDLRAAMARGDRGHAAALLVTLRHFLHEHPDAALADPRTIH